MDFGKPISKYLLEKDNLIGLVVFTAVFSLVFINLYQPYGSRDWLQGGISETRYFLLSLLLVFIGMCVVAVSRIILYKHCKKLRRPVTLWTYSLWIAAEVISIAFSFTVLEMSIFDDERSFLELLKISFVNTFWILLIPYTLAWLFFSWRDKDRRLKAIADYRGGARGPQPADAALQPMVIFYDAKGDVKLSVKAQDLVYIKGADNYLTVHYVDGEKMGSYMVRSTFKSVEVDLKEKGIIRCHRSYMVNRRHVKLYQKGKDGFVVKLDAVPPIDIPVSKNYVSDVSGLFSEE